MSKYSKLIGSVIGAVVGLLLAIAANAGFGSCDLNGENCTVFGFTQETLTTALMMILSFIGVERAPANTE